MIETPGFYEIPAEDYHADPCPTPSLSASLGIPLLHRSPRHAWCKHPRLNPDYEGETSTRLALGTAAHSLLFQAGAKLDVLDFRNYQTKAAQQARDESYAAGRTPVLAADYERASQMAEVAWSLLVEELGEFPGRGRNEAVMAWREGDAWCRAMVDHVSADLRTVVDLKTTSSSANPLDAERTLYDLHYHFRAAFYERGLNVLDPRGLGRRRTLFLFQEVDPPYECSLIQPAESGMTIGRKQVTAAIQLWQRCIAANEWPGYPRHVWPAPIPTWHETRWTMREMVDPSLTGALSPDAGDFVEPESNRAMEWTP
jgi:hypothetical protein